jgi:hypothetical protein
VILFIVKLGVRESFNEFDNLGELDERGLELDVLVDLKLRVSVLLFPILGV